jgi:hypothetical protein
MHLTLFICPPDGGGQILSNGVAPNAAPINVPVTFNIDATGADAAGLSRVQQQLAELKASLPGTIVATVTKAKQRRAL